LSSDFRLLRLEYLFTVIVPIFIAILINQYDIMAHISIIGGFSFWAITGNTLNDIKDMDNPDDIETQKRIEGYSKKEIAVLSISSFVMGSTLFFRSILGQPIILLYLLFTAIFVVFYCMIVKPILIINWIILGISHIWLPYFIIKINANAIIGWFPIIQPYEWFFLISASLIALSGNLIHEVIDNDAITRLSLRKQQIILWIISFVAIIFSIISILLFIEHLVLFSPFLLIPIGVIYMARSKDNLPHGAKTIKNIGIIVGNLLLAFIVILFFTTY